MQLKPFTLSNDITNKTRFSIIIPARNEALNIEHCLLSVINQHYPKNLFEIIVVDDFSTDQTADKVVAMQRDNANIRLIQLSQMVNEKSLNSYKKKAIDIAIQSAAGDVIVTTDADCRIPANWLKLYNDYLVTTNSVFVAAPVFYTDNGSFVSKFQCLDFMSLQGITAASVAAGFHSMCNGANLAYRKDVYNEVGGFKGIDNIASGDDMMLMHKIFKKYASRVGYLFSADAVVLTKPMPTWKDFFNQRIRWASKADKFQDYRIVSVLALVYLLNLCLVLIPVAAIWYHNLIIWWLVFFAIKIIIELRFMSKIATFFAAEKLMKWFPVMQPFHIFYTIIAGWLGKFGAYKWKGRTVK